MKNSILCRCVIVGLFVSSTFPTFAENIFYRDLPDQVRKAMQKHRDNLDRIEKFTSNGQTIYEVQLEKGGFIYFGEDGSRLTDPSLRSRSLAAAGKLKLNNLPAPVKKTFRKEAGAATASNIQIESLNGKNIYDIAFTRNGQADQIRINEDGSLAQAGQIGQSQNTGNAAGKTVAAFERPLAASQKVDFEKVPEAVKRTVRGIAGSNRIEDAERGTLDGRAIYEIAFKENGVHNEVRVAEDGSLVQRTTAGTASVSAAAPTTGAKRVDLGNVTIDQVPERVRQTIRAQVGTGEINDIDKLSLNGKTIYEVGFKKKNGGSQQEIQIAEDGTFMGEAAGAQP